MPRQSSNLGDFFRAAGRSIRSEFTNPFRGTTSAFRRTDPADDRSFMRRLWDASVESDPLASAIRDGMYNARADRIADASSALVGRQGDTIRARAMAALGEQQAASQDLAQRRAGEAPVNTNYGPPAHLAGYGPGAPLPAWMTPGAPIQQPQTSTWEQGQAPSFLFQQSILQAPRSGGTDYGDEGYGILRSSASEGRSPSSTPGGGFWGYGSGANGSSALVHSSGRGAPYFGNMGGGGGSGGTGGGSGGGGGVGGAGSSGGSSGSGSGGGGLPWYSSAYVRTGTRIK